MGDSSTPRHPANGSQARRSSRLAPIVIFGAIFIIAALGVSVVLSHYDEQEVHPGPAQPEVREPGPDIEEIPDERRPEPGPEGDPLDEPGPGPHPPANPDGDESGQEP